MEEKGGELGSGTPPDMRMTGVCRLEEIGHGGTKKSEGRGKREKLMDIEHNSLQFRIVAVHPAIHKVK